jgi:hypothetical protein
MSGAANPPAFPPAITVSASGDFYHGFDGMTLRDWFAGQALNACIEHSYGNDWGKDGKEWPGLVAQRAYRIADAMLAARGGVS